MEQTCLNSNRSARWMQMHLSSRLERALGVSARILLRSGRKKPRPTINKIWKHNIQYSPNFSNGFPQSHQIPISIENPVYCIQYHYCPRGKSVGVTKYRTLRNSVQLKAIQGESKVISGTLWEREKCSGKSNGRKCLKSYFAQMLNFFCFSDQISNRMYKPIFKAISFYPDINPRTLSVFFQQFPLFNFDKIIEIWCCWFVNKSEYFYLAILHMIPLSYK